LPPRLPLLEIIVYPGYTIVIKKGCRFFELNPKNKTEKESTSCENRSRRCFSYGWEKGHEAF
jgi:hypothetical protein